MSKPYWGCVKCGSIKYQMCVTCGGGYNSNDYNSSDINTTLSGRLWCCKCCAYSILCVPCSDKQSKPEEISPSTPPQKVLEQWRCVVCDGICSPVKVTSTTFANLSWCHTCNKYTSYYDESKPKETSPHATPLQKVSRQGFQINLAELDQHLADHDPAANTFGIRSLITRQEFHLDCARALRGMLGSLHELILETNEEVGVINTKIEEINKALSQ